MQCSKKTYIILGLLVQQHVDMIVFHELYVGGAENAGRENAGHENDGPSSRA